MDEENLRSWIVQPDVCRCCLSTSGIWDLTASYITDAGIKEVFSEMLLECYGISLSHLSEWGPSRLVCGLCVGHLREACSFRKQVLRAAECFTQHCVNRTEPFVKTEELESVCPDDFTNDLRTGSDVDDIKDLVKTQTNEVADTLTTAAKEHRSKRKKQKATCKTKRKRKKINLDSDCDSDAPIAALSKKRIPSELSLKALDGTAENLEQICELKNNMTSDIVNVEEIINEGPQHTLRPETAAKQISERKRVVLTCSIVLRDTTACPFRHHKSWFQCFFCTQDFMEISSLRDHTLTNHRDIDAELKKMKRYPRSLQIDISNLECRICSLNMPNVDLLRRHFETVHNKVIYNECIADYKVDCSPYFCHICDQEFHVFRTLTTHLNEHYANCICDVCGRSFINSKRLKVHKRTHESGHFPCSECGKVLKTKTSKSNHMESAHSKRVIKCQICFKPMKHYNDRIKHMSEEHDITHKFKCPICSREYNIKHYLATHMRQTHGNKNKKCTTCGMAFITNHGLKKHMLKHTGEKPFSCSVCTKSYARSYTLREHMRGHENDRRFLCPE